MISSLWPSCAPQRFYCPKRRFRSASPKWRWRSASDYPDDLHVIAVLKGAFIFLSDLARAHARPRLARLHGRLELRQGHDLVRRSARWSRTSTPPLDGRNVVIVEDIVDTGLTLSYLQQILRARAPEVAAHRVPAEQAVAPQGRRRGRIHRLHDRGPLRRRLRPRLRRAVPQPAAHRGVGTMRTLIFLLERGAEARRKS